LKTRIFFTLWLPQRGGQRRSGERRPLPQRSPADSPMPGRWSGRTVTGHLRSYRRRLSEQHSPTPVRRCGSEQSPACNQCTYVSGSVTAVKSRGVLRATGPTAVGPVFVPTFHTFHGRRREEQEEVRRSFGASPAVSAPGLP